MTDTEPTPDQSAVKDAIRRALKATGDAPDNHDATVEAIAAELRPVLTDTITKALKATMETPAYISAVSLHVAAPVIQEAEDAINDDHDDPKTPDTMRPGLRRAAKTLREIRRTITEEAPKL